MRHHLHAAEQGRGLPVALAAEAEAVGHQPLHGEAGQLTQASEVLEVRGEGAEAALVQERAQAQLDAGAVAQGIVPIATRQQLGRDPVGVGVLGDQRVDVAVADLVHDGDEVVDAVGVDRDAEPELGLDLVALGDGDVAHVVAEPGQPQGAQLGAAHRGSRPRGDAGDDHR